jgi:hypothetical protein
LENGQTKRVRLFTKLAADDRFSRAFVVKNFMTTSWKVSNCQHFRAIFNAHQKTESLPVRVLQEDGVTSNRISLIALDCWKQIQQFCWQQGDQRSYVSDTRLFQKATGCELLASLAPNFFYSLRSDLYNPFVTQYTTE